MKKSFFQLHIAIFLASCSGIFGKLISLDAVFTTWYRMLFASLIMICIFVFSKEKRKISLSDKNIYKIMGAGIILGLHWIFFYGSIKYANVSVGVVCFCLSGFFTAFLSPLINRQKLAISEVLLSALTIFGILLISHFDNSFRTGIILGIISSLLFALFTVLNEKINQKEDAKYVTMLEMLGGTIGISLLLPVYTYYFPSAKFELNGSDLIYLIILALFCTNLMYLLLNRVQKTISAFTVSLSFNLEPIYSIVIAIVLFQEDKELTLSFYVGLSLIILSLILQMLRISYSKRRI